MTTATSQAAASEELLPADLRVELWKRIERRLRKGEVLITSEQFFKAMAKDFKRLVRVDPDRRIKIELLQMIIQVNETHPETYLTMGIKNAVKTFIQDAQKGGADEEGTESLQEMMASMVREGRTAMWLEGMGINVDERTLTTRLEQTILSIIEGKKVRGRAERRERTRRQRRPASEMVGVRTTEVEAVGEAEPPAVEGPPTMEEQQQRAAEEKERTAEMVAEEIERAPRNLDSYQNQKLLSEDEASKLRELYGIGQRLADGEIDDEEAQRLRDEIGEVVREKLEARLREAVDHSLHYITTFEALKRLPGDRDAALRLLIKHKNQVVAEDAEKIDLSVVTSTLEKDDDLLENLGLMMERKDHEMRMLAADMPPYRHIYSGEKLGKYTVGESFVGDLREVEREELSEKLNSEDSDVRLKAAGDIKSMLALLNAFMKVDLPFHHEVRRLRIILRMKNLYNGAMDEKDGRNRVQQFLRRRLNNLYPDLTREEKAAIEAAGNSICEVSGGDDEEGGDRAKRVYRV